LEWHPTNEDDGAFRPNPQGSSPLTQATRQRVGGLFTPDPAVRVESTTNYVGGKQPHSFRQRTNARDVLRARTSPSPPWKHRSG